MPDDPLIQDVVESEVLLANDLQVLVAELNRRLTLASERGIEVLLSVERAWTVANPAMKSVVRIKILAQLR